MKLSSTPLRRSSVATLVAAAAMLAAFILPAAALADHQAQMAPTSTYQPGCQAKGLFAQPGPTPVGGLSPGFYAYTVTALVGAAETTPCPPVVTGVGAAPANSVSLQWNSVPGATAYNVYRAPYNPSNGTTGTFTLVQYLSPAFAPACPRAASANQNGPAANAANGNGRGSRCDAHDNNPSTTGAPLTKSTPPVTLQAGAAADMKLVQCVDYGGAVRSTCPFSPPAPSGTPIDDPQAATNANALKTDDLHFPPGLNARPGAAPVCKLSGPAPSLLGSTTLRGSQDPDEDTCPRESLVGNAVTISRVKNSANEYSVTRGDIYMGERQAGEAARLFIVLRPNCSAGSPSPFNPGGQACSSPQGLNSNLAEVEKEFLAAPSTFVRRVDSSGNVTYGIDVRTISAASGGPLPSTLAVLAPTGPGGSFQTFTEIGVQVHQLQQILFGRTDQNTADTSDDQVFLTLPTSCGDHTLTADKTTYAHDAVSSASTNVPTNNCEALEFTPELTAVASGPTATGAHPALDVTVTQSATEAPSRSVKVTLPVQFGTNLAALSITCTEAELNADACPASKAIGTATAESPLSGTLTGNVYLMSQTGALPKLVVKLKGLINLDLVGSVDIAGGNRIVNLFSSVPDVPLTRFNLHVNSGDNGLLTNLSDLCNGIGNADGEFTAHSGKTATSSAPVQLNATCTATGASPGVSKRAKVRIVLAKVKSGKPTLRVVVTRGSTAIASRIKTVRLSLPRGLKIIRKDSLEQRLTVNAVKELLPITQLVVRARSLVVDKIPGGPAPKVTEKFLRKALKSSGSLKRKGKRARPVFRLKVTTYANKTYSYRIKVKPRS